MQSTGGASGPWALQTFRAAHRWEALGRQKEWNDNDVAVLEGEVGGGVGRAEPNERLAGAVSFLKGRRDGAVVSFKRGVFYGGENRRPAGGLDGGPDSGVVRKRIFAGVFHFAIDEDFDGLAGGWNCGGCDAGGVTTSRGWDADFGAFGVAVGAAAGTEKCDADQEKKSSLSHAFGLRHITEGWRSPLDRARR